DLVADEAPQGVGRVPGLGHDAVDVDEVVPEALHDGGQQVRLALEMEVEGGPGDAGRLADVVHPDAVEPRPVEQVAGHVEDLFPAGAGPPPLSGRGLLVHPAPVWRRTRPARRNLEEDAGDAGQRRAAVATRSVATRSVPARMGP